jgi:crossover junction endodeoxyribonuclease RuvC
VIDIQGSRIMHVAHGVISPHETLPFSIRLLQIFEGVSQVVAAHSPQEAAVEETFLNTNASSTLKLGHARASAMIAPASAGLPVSEYAAKVVKKALVGTGAATKDQVGFMIRRLLPTCGLTSADAADALAVAITHAHNRSTFVRQQR